MAPAPDELASSIPPGTVEVLREQFEHGDRSYDCVLDGVIVGWRVRTPNGTLNSEFGKRNGRYHGLARRWTDEGVLIWQSFYLDGLEHGTARQYEGGKLIGTYTMEHGTGLDLWRDEGGLLAEEHHMKHGYRHGYERWWGRDDRTVWQEFHFKMGVEHGIFRDWNIRGRLRRGYPQYFVDGKRVTRRQYLRAAASDPSLPPFRSEENQPFRKLPPEHFASLPPELRRAREADAVADPRAGMSGHSPLVMR